MNNQIQLGLVSHNILPPPAGFMGTTSEKSSSERCGDKLEMKGSDTIKRCDKTGDLYEALDSLQIGSKGLQFVVIPVSIALTTFSPD